MAGHFPIAQARRLLPARALALALAALCLAWSFPPSASAEPACLPSQEMNRLTLDMTRAYDRVNDYVTVFSRRGMRDAELCPRETILLKFRKPFSVYMKWIEEPKKGQQILFKDGWNDGQVRVQTGFFPYLTLNLDPCGNMIRNESFGRSFLEVGIGNMIKTFVKNVHMNLTSPARKLTLREIETSRIFGETVRCLEAVNPDGFAGKTSAPKARIWISQDSGLPVKLMIFGRADELLEEYCYYNTRTNVGLKDMDFDPDNPEYDF